MLRFLKAIYTMLHRRGPGYLGYLISGVLLPKILYRLIYTADSYRLWRGVRLMGVSISVLLVVLLAFMVGWQISLASVLGIILLGFLCLRFAQEYKVYRVYQKARSLSRDRQGKNHENHFTTWSDLQASPGMRRSVDEAWNACSQDELLIGQIDQDGRVLGVYGVIDGMDMTSEEDFQPRIRYKLDIVLCEGYVLLRKDFGRDYGGFVREWCHLLVLADAVNVPAIYKVDEVNHRLYINFIAGRTMRDILVEAGARILDLQIKDDPELAALDLTERASRINERGRRLVPECFSEAFLVQLQKQFERVHSCKLASLDIKYGNVILHPKDGSPWIVDFENAWLYADVTSPVFLFKRDRDRTKINHLFHRDLLTETSARSYLKAQGMKMPWYAPLDFGNGLTVGPFWSTDTGMGRWEYLNRRILAPLVHGKRILDLGSNNGTMPMMMLRSGAEEVVGLELSSTEIERAKLIRRIFEWRDMREYRLNIHNLNMLEVLHYDWGRFDVVTAFCSLYYLEEEQMANVVRRAAELAPCMVVQVNTSNQQNAQKHIKASVQYTKKLLEENGFLDAQVFAPKNFTRPLLIGKRTVTS